MTSSEHVSTQSRSAISVLYFWLNLASSLLSGSPHQEARLGILWFIWRGQGKGPKSLRDLPLDPSACLDSRAQLPFFPIQEEHIPLQLMADPSLQSTRDRYKPLYPKEGHNIEVIFFLNDRAPPNPSFHGRVFNVVGRAEVLQVFT